MKTLDRDKARIEETTDTSAKVVETMSMGDAWRQGDLEIRYVGKSLPPQVQPTPTPTQLAPGTTKGSRHMLDAVGVSAFVFSDPSPLEGPVLKCPGGLTVTHPEHGDITLKEPGVYVITYQRAFAEELRRQRD